MEKRKIAIILLSTILGSSTLVFLGLFLSFLATSNMYKNQLENAYMKSFYEMVDSVNNIELDLSKVVATNDIDSQRILLSSVYENCVLGVNNINQLPIENNKLSSLNKFLNTTGGFVSTLLDENYSGNVISDSNLAQVGNIYARVKEIQYDLNMYMCSLQYDYSILDEVDFDDAGNSEFSAGLVNNESSTGQVPTLIYDGPFSDSVINKEIKGLGEVDYTREQAEEYLHDIFSGFAIYYIGETLGKFETYNFDVKGDIDLYVSVTKKGGFLLSITAFGGGENNKLSVVEGVELAQVFAKDVGIDNMYSVWQQLSGNILYVNLAPIVNKVIYYSDLIKVKVDLSLGLVVGWEGTNYAINHQDREFSSSLTILDCEKKLNDLMTVKERNFCIVPDRYVGELSAYEYICTWNDYTYYIYLDSNTGKEIDIMRVINTTNGELLQ